ncbi:MAG TPA: hypothetical protein P5293_01420 [Bacteroidales bacterium]|nr:hypothetical protein [Bacteroidales bacterium]
MKKFVLLVVIVFLLPNLFSITVSAQMSLPEKEFIVKEKVKEQDKIIKEDARKKKIIYNRAMEEEKQSTINNSVVQSYVPAESQSIKIKNNSR